MKIKSFCYIVITIIFLISCVPARFYIAEDFNTINSNATILITQVNEINISQNYDLYPLDSLRKIRNLFFEYQRALLPNSIKNWSKLKSVGVMNYKTPPQFEKKEFFVNEKEIVELHVPISKMKYDKEGSYYILFFQDYNISFDLEETDTSNPAKLFSTEKIPGLEPSLKPNKLYKQLFTIRTKYFIYDNDNSKLIIAGNAVIKEKYSFEKNLDNVMSDAIAGLAQRIIEKTPFEE